MKSDKEQQFKTTIELIRKGQSLRDSISEAGLYNDAFYAMIEASEEKKEQYVRACEARADAIFEDILKISDTPREGITTRESSLGIEVSTGDMIAHRRLQVDARKWMLSKMNPKKYGDKIDVTSKDEKINNQPIIIDWSNNDKTDTEAEGGE